VLEKWEIYSVSEMVSVFTLTTTQKGVCCVGLWSMVSFYMCTVLETWEEGSPENLRGLED